MKHKKVGIIIIFILAAIAFSGVMKHYSFTCGNYGTDVTTEMISPLFNTVYISGDTDTDVIFTNVKTGETINAGYITLGMGTKIHLENGEWYTIDGGGAITVKPVKTCVYCPE